MKELIAFGCVSVD